MTERIARTLRLPADLTEKLKVEARKNERSLHAEIVNRLRLSLEGWKR